MPQSHLRPAHRDEARHEEGQEHGPQRIERTQQHPPHHGQQSLVTAGRPASVEVVWVHRVRQRYGGLAVYVARERFAHVVGVLFARIVPDHLPV